MSTSKKAKELGIVGTVQNCKNGNVEVFAQGEDASLEAFESWLQVGPDMAEVDSVVMELIEEEDWNDFKII